MAVNHLEAIISKLLLPDTDTVTQATKELKNIFKNQEIYAALCNLFCSSGNTQIRQYAAVLLRRKISKKHYWNKLNADIKNGIKSSVLKSLGVEIDKSVRNAVGQLAGCIAKYELPRNAWPELLQHLKNAIASANNADRELGLYVLSIVAATSAAQLQPYLKQLIQLLGRCLQDRASSDIPFYSLKTLTSLGCMIGSDELQLFQNLIPHIMNVIGHLVPLDEDKACEALQIFDELIESEVGVLAPHIKALVEFCLQISGDSSLGNEIRVKAITTIGSIAHSKKKTLLKHKLVQPILKILFTIMCSQTDDDNEDDIPYEGAESSSPVAVAAQVIDILALHLPPEKLLQPLMHFVEAALGSENPFERRAAYIALAVTVEGCADYIRNKYVPQFVQCLFKGITDPIVCVRNASLFALGQFAEHLQPDIGNYAQEMLPLILQCLKDKIQCENTKTLPSTTKLFYALENFCDCLGERLLPFLPSIVEQLFLSLNNGSLRVQELAVSSIAVIVNEAKEAMRPYFEKILEYLKIILSQSSSDDVMPVQLQALETLGVLIRTFANDSCITFVKDSIHLGLQILGSIDDPDIRRCTYGLFASVSTKIHEDMSSYLPTIIPHMIGSLMSTEGVVVQPSSDSSGADQFPFFVDLSDEDEEEDDDKEVDLGVGDSDCSEEDEYEDDGVGLDIENSYLKEKEDTCNFLKEIAFNTRCAFLPYLEKANEEVTNLLEHPAGVVRAAALEALAQFCCTFRHALSGLNPGDPVCTERKNAVGSTAVALLLKLTLIVREDKDRSVAMAALEAINEMIKHLGEFLFSERNHINTVIGVVKDVLQLKMACQDHSDEVSTDDNSDDQQAEYDQMLLEYAGEIVPSLAKVIQPGSQFAPYFAGILSILVLKTKRKMGVSEKSFSVGILAESVAAMKEGITPFVSHLYPVFLSLAQDENEEVRSNSIFGLGVLVEFGGPAVANFYTNILQLLSNTLAQETDNRVTDNICGAVARMIITKSDAVPVDQVLPVVMRFLPLKQDYEENLTIVRCMSHLLNIKHPEVLNQMPNILKVMAEISHTPQVSEETQMLLDRFVQEVSINCAAGFSEVLQSLTIELSDKLRHSANIQRS
ncbi:hypothetical protein CHUAL_003425 [Chamberlinius hualienensis]